MMNRLSLPAVASALVAFVVISLGSLSATAETSVVADGNYQEGVHYARLQIPIKTRARGKVEVAEYFSYGCPHCYQFEPSVAAWHARMPKDVSFSRTPAVWNNDYKVYARAYYTAKALKVLDRTHGPVFRAIQQERRRLNTPESMAEFFATLGVSEKDFLKAYNSFGVNASVQQADSKGRAYRSSGVPAIIINGKYRVEGGMAGSNANMIKVADFLIAKERALLNK